MSYSKVPTPEHVETAARLLKVIAERATLKRTMLEAAGEIEKACPWCNASFGGGGLRGCKGRIHVIAARLREAAK